MSESDDDDESDDDPDDDSDSESAYDADDDTDDPVQMLIDFLVNLLALRVLTAKHFCYVIYFIGRAYNCTRARDIGLKPGSGHYNRKVRKTTGLYRKTDLYKLRLPGRTHSSLGRVVADFLGVWGFMSW